MYGTIRSIEIVIRIITSVFLKFFINIPQFTAATNDKKNAENSNSLKENCNMVNKILPGTITRTDKDSIYIACSDQEIRILKIQISGKKQMSVRDYLNGQKNNTLKGKVLK